MHHIMIDLETLGTVPGCSILSIGAVEFFPDLERLGQEFYTVISTNSCEEAFLLTDPDTMDWWGKQAPEARAVLDAAATSSVTLAAGLEKYNEFLAGIGPKSKIREYGNGADFDNPIVRVAFDAAKVKPYAGSYGGRCYRTLKNLDELFGPALGFHKLSKGGDRMGVHHNALDDAKSQAVHLMRNLARIKRAMEQAGLKEHIK